MTAAGQTSTRPHLSAWKVTALRTALWMLVAAGPVGAVAVWIQLDAIDTQLQIVADRAVSAPVVDTAEVEGVAELAIADFIAGSATAGPPTSTVGTVSLGAAEVSTGYFAVTVATTTPAPDVAAPVRFYLIGVVAHGSDWVVVGPPALVAGPTTALATDTQLAKAGLGDIPGLANAVEGFLTAYLTGDGDVTRYTAPGLAITAVTPPPFVEVEILEAGTEPREAGVRIVVVTVQGSDPSGGIQVLRYSMAMAEQAGRWEVAELLPVPPLEEVGSDG